MESTPAPPLPSRLASARSPSRGTLRRARAIAEAVFARELTAPPAPRLDWLEAELEDFLARSGARSRLMLSFSIWLVATLAALIAGWRTRFEGLGLEARVASLQALERVLPEPLLAVKALLCLVYYEHPDAAAEVGVRVPHLVAALPARREPEARA